jgi:hypothetical protein
MVEQILYRPSTIECPICHINQKIEIPDYIYQQKHIGLIKVQVRPGTACPHEFIVYVDQLGKARDYEHADFQIQLTARTPNERAASDQFSLEDLLETLGTFATLRVFHAFIFNYKILVLIVPTDDPKFVDNLNDLFTRSFPAHMKPERLADKTRLSEFAMLDMEESKTLILDTKGVIVDSPWGDQKDFDFETELIKKALEFNDLNAQLLFIQQRVGLFKKETEDVIALLEKVGQMIYDDDLRDKLAKLFHRKLTDHLVTHYIHFIKQRYPESEPLLRKIHNRSVESLKEGIW